MTSDFKREFYLKQHSHLLHFQFQQAGACLRATELKPKLDRFLIEHHFKNDKSRYEKLLIGYIESKKKEDEEDDNQKKALNYKVSIQSSNSLNSYEYKGMGGNSARTGILYAKTKISVFSYEKELLVAIEKWMEPFLALHNFGFRQSKGFGCFTLLNQPTQESFEEFLHIRFPYFWRYQLRPGLGKKDAYTFIQEEYIKLKRMNVRHKRKKPKIFEYMMGQNPPITWEKARIKGALKKDHPKIFEHLLREYRPDNNLERSEPAKEEAKFQYIRALLGLAEHNEYRMDGSGGLNKIQIKIDDKAGKIKRFQSPLQFKLFQNFIYILPHPIPSEMFDRKFKFILKGVYNPATNERETDLFDLSTPSADEFSMEAFLDYALNEPDWKREPSNE